VLDWSDSGIKHQAILDGNNSKAMKLHQLKYLLATVEHDFNITTAADKIFTSQPGISKQLKLLEEELDIKIFQRSGKQLVGLTATGEQVVEHAKKVLHEIENIKRLSDNKNQVIDGDFRLATTQTQAKYVLPSTLTQFHKRYPKLTIDIQHASIEHITQLLLQQKIDFAIASDSQDLHPDIIKIPCYHWNRTIIFPQSHPLSDEVKPKLKDIAKHPIVTYKEAESGNSSLRKAMQQEKLDPNIVFTARDADVIKTYVRNNMGVGILAEMAFDPKVDNDLFCFSAKDFLPQCTTWIAFNKNLLMRDHMLDFIKIFAPHLSKETLQLYFSQKNTIGADGVSSSTESLLPMH